MKAYRQSFGTNDLILSTFNRKEKKLISKEKIKAYIDNFEEDTITVDALIERLIFIEKWKSE